MKKNNSGFSIVIGTMLTIFIMMIAYYLLAYIIPFGKNVKGIENSGASYYYAYGGIEKSLKYVKDRTNLMTETGIVMPTTGIGVSYNTSSSGGVLPITGKGNSEYDKNNSIIAVSNPIQIEVGKSILVGGIYNLDYFRLTFKVPAFTGTTLTLSGGNIPIINFSLSAGGNTLLASGSQIKANEIQNSLYNTFNTSTNISIKGKEGLDLLGNGQSFGNFYDSNCKGTNSGCILKFSVINELKTTSGIKIPYLEYRINSARSLPLYYTDIKSSGKSYGFKKNLEVQVPQQTTNEAFDFTVFQ